MKITNENARAISKDPKFASRFIEMSKQEFPSQDYVAIMSAMIAGAEWALNYAEEFVTKTLSSDGDIDFLDFMIKKGWGLHDEYE